MPNPFLRTLTTFQSALNSGILRSTVLREAYRQGFDSLHQAIAAAMPEASTATHLALAQRAAQSYAAAELIVGGNTGNLNSLIPRVGGASQPLAYRYYVNAYTASRNVPGDLRRGRGRFQRNIAIDSMTPLSDDELRRLAAEHLAQMIREGDESGEVGRHDVGEDYEVRNVNIELYAVTRQ